MADPLDLLSDPAEPMTALSSNGNQQKNVMMLIFNQLSGEPLCQIEISRNADIAAVKLAIAEKCETAKKQWFTTLWLSEHIKQQFLEDLLIPL